MHSSPHHPPVLHRQRPQARAGARALCAAAIFALAFATPGFAQPPDDPEPITPVDPTEPTVPTQPSVPASISPLDRPFLPVDPAVAGTVRPLIDQVDLFPGASTLLIPIAVEGAGGGGGGGVFPGAVTIRLDDQPAPASLVCLSIIPQPPKAPASPRSRWSHWWGGAGQQRWTASATPPPASLDPSAPAPQSSWFIRLDVSALKADPTRLGLSKLSIGSGSVLVRRLEQPLIDSGRSILRSAVEQRVLAARSPQALNPLINLALPLASIPSERWRARLILEACREPVPPIVGSMSQGPIDAALVELADQLEARWFAAVGRLSLADEALARELAARLCTIVVSEQHVLPFFVPTDPQELQLCAQLLQADRSRDGLIRAAREFIASRPNALAWVDDDAALIAIEPSRDENNPDANAAASPSQMHFKARVWAANLSATSGLAVLAMSWGASTAPQELPGYSALELTTLPPLATNPAAAEAPVDENTRSATATQLAARLGSTSTTLTTIKRALLVRPPGFDVPQLAADWSLASLSRGSPDLPQPDDDSTFPVGVTYTTNARLFFDDSAINLDPTQPKGKWMLFIQCRQGAGELNTDDRVTIHLGPAFADLATLTLTPRGILTDLSAKGRSTPPMTLNTVLTPADPARQTPAQWTAWVPLPSGAVESSGLLRIAITRTDPRGVRSTFPRPMLPWQIQPGRLPLDTTSWLALPK
jgi:hypothetical protein